jgi:hypothetical protein
MGNEMKKLFLIFGLTVFLIGCGGGNEQPITEFKTLPSSMPTAGGN